MQVIFQAPINNWLVGSEVASPFTDNRWWVYQRERFPVFANGLLIAAFSFSAVSFSALLRGQNQLPLLSSVVVAFIAAFMFFLQLRIADEFKDIDEDTQYRPYRPVPRGLIKLRELAIVGVLAGLIQLLTGWWLDRSLIIILAVVWVYLALMSKEFFVREWLTNKPVTYMWSHMLIMPLIDFYATACDWMVASGSPPAGLFWFLIVSFFNGIVIEIGRKIRAPEDEETGVDTYTVLWGRPVALLAWVGAMVCTAISAVMAASNIDFVVFVSALLIVLIVLALLLCWCFLRRPTTKIAKYFEWVSGVWTLLMYLSLGAAPMVWRIWS